MSSVKCIIRILPPEWTHSSILWLMREKTLKEANTILIKIQVFMAKKTKCHPLIYYTAISSVITTFGRNLLPLVHLHPPPAIHTNMCYTKLYITRLLCNTGSWYYKAEIWLWVQVTIQTTVAEDLNRNSCVQCLYVTLHAPH